MPLWLWNCWDREMNGDKLARRIATISIGAFVFMRVRQWNCWMPGVIILLSTNLWSVTNIGVLIAAWNAGRSRLLYGCCYRFNGGQKKCPACSGTYTLEHYRKTTVMSGTWNKCTTGIFWTHQQPSEWRVWVSKRRRQGSIIDNQCSIFKSISTNP